MTTDLIQAQHHRPPPISTRWRVKLGFRIIALTLPLVMIFIGASLASMGAIESIVFVSSPAGLSIVWNSTEIVCILKREGHHSAHPGLAVAVDLILWLSFLVAAPFVLVARTFTSESGLFNLSLSGYRYGDKKVPPDDYRRHEAIVALMLLNMIFHFALFVIACSETRRRNRTKRVVQE